jgi:hypothetical protein
MTDESGSEAPEPPDIDLVEEWDRTVEDRPTKERVYEVVTSLTDPTPVATIAERADCSPNGARSNLEWFVELGIVDRVADEPALYRRNDAYFEFLRVNRLASEYGGGELSALIEEYERREASLAAAFDVDDPDDIDPLTFDTDGDFESLYDRLSEWRTVRRRLRDLRRAQLLNDRNDPSDVVPA